MNKTLSARPPVALAPRNTCRVVIIGGGISGLSAAWHLERLTAERGLAVEYTLLEAASRWGGKVLTEHVATDSGNVVIEAGPDSFITQKPWALELVRELGIDDRLIPISNRTTAIHVLQRGQPVRMPDGVLLTVPTRLRPFLASSLISWRGKLRMGLDLVVPAQRDDEDEPLARFVRRRLGAEALDKIAEPLMSGIYNADAETMSIMATFPRFRHIEKEHGSLIRGMQKAAAQERNREKPAPAFMSLRAGAQELTDALVSRLHGELRLATRVIGIEECAHGYRIITDSDVMPADAIIMTVPAPIAADLLAPLAREAAARLRDIRCAATGTMSLAFRASDVRRPLDSIGLLVPKTERRPINGITISSAKFDHRAPEGTALLRVFFGGSRSPASMDYDDEQLRQVVYRELREIFGIESSPLAERIYRWPDASPQYDVGHLERVEKIEASLPHGVYVTGAAYRGVGIPDCIRQSRLTTDRMLSALATARGMRA